MASSIDAVVVGSGPNGLAAAITVAQAGRSVLVVEAESTVGGGMRTMEVTAPGFHHDICSAIHPLGRSSPFFRALPLDRYGLEWIDPDLPLAHPLDDGPAVLLHRSVDETAAGLDQDARAYRRLMAPLARNAEALTAELLGPLRPPRHPVVLGRFGPLALRSARGLALRSFRGERARAVFAGLAAHSFQDLSALTTAGFGLSLGYMAHAVGWPLPRGGSQRIADALVAHLASLGGSVEVGRPIKAMGDLPAARAYLFDVTPRQLVSIAGDRLGGRYRRALERYRYGPGVFKLDLALDGPVPWRDPACSLAGTVHVGGSLADIAASESAAASGRVAERPFILVAQQSRFDSSRAPAGQHTLWAYCHVPNGSPVDMTEAMEAQVERFAPGFRDRIIARRASFPSDVEDHNANLVGGDINGGLQDIRQLFTRPTFGHLYTTPDPAIYLCSSSTPPGGGVHGMCGWWAAQAALKRALR